LPSIEVTSHSAEHAVDFAAHVIGGFSADMFDLCLGAPLVRESLVPALRTEHVGLVVVLLPVVFVDFEREEAIFGGALPVEKTSFVCFEWNGQRLAKAHWGSMGLIVGFE